jgi:hypothetical protein
MRTISEGHFSAYIDDAGTQVGLVVEKVDTWLEVTFSGNHSSGYPKLLLNLDEAIQFGGELQAAAIRSQQQYCDEVSEDLRAAGRTA